MKNKKGDLAFKIIISLVILLVTGIIVFFFISMMPFKETVDKEACHQSVVLRSQQIVVLKPGQTLGIPLRCKTEEIIIDSSDEKEIKKEIANALYDCWWMLGEGEMNFFGRGWTKDTYCVLCSTIEFSETTQGKIKEIHGIDNYLIETNIPGQDFSYAQFLTTNEAPQITKEQESVLDTSKKYAVSYAMIERSAATGRVTGIAAGAVGVFVGFKIGGGVKAAAVLGSLFAGGGNWVTNQIQNLVEGTSVDYYVALDLIPLEAQALKDFGCTSIESIP